MNWWPFQTFLYFRCSSLFLTFCWHRKPLRDYFPQGDYYTRPKKIEKNFFVHIQKKWLMWYQIIVFFVCDNDWFDKSHWYAVFILQCVFLKISANCTHTAQEINQFTITTFFPNIPEIHNLAIPKCGSMQCRNSVAFFIIYSRINERVLSLKICFSREQSQN